MHGNGTYLCLLRGDPTAASVAASQIRTVLSPESPLLAIHLPQGEYATDVTADLLKNTKFTREGILHMEMGRTGDRTGSTRTQTCQLTPTLTS